ncbi:MAG TPA: hypothetical protein VKC60_12745, partial [Opitutaceae bacterium]|nr:hypothetical protein [Opitutaceae bacterium]
MTIRERLLEFLHRPKYIPASSIEIAKQLNFNKSERRSLEFEIRYLLGKGELVRIKGDKLVLPSDADLVTGKIHFRAGDSAFVVPEGKANEPDRP